MDHAGRVAVGEARQQPVHQASHLGAAGPLIALQHRFQRAAVDELHDDVGQLVRLGIVEHAHDVGMMQPPGGLRFQLEAAQQLAFLAIASLRQANGLDGDLA